MVVAVAVVAAAAAVDVAVDVPLMTAAAPAEITVADSGPLGFAKTEGLNRVADAKEHASGVVEDDMKVNQDHRILLAFASSTAVVTSCSAS